MLPGAMGGIGVGWATAAWTADDLVRLLVGLVAVAFVARWAWGALRRRAIAPRAPHGGRAALWGALAGWTSFVAHAGGPPFAVHAVPLGLAPAALTGTAVAFFTAVNYAKLLPYWALGELGGANLLAAAAMLPVALLFVALGAWAIRRMRPELFYPLTYALTLLVGLRLLWEGARGLL